MQEIITNEKNIQRYLLFIEHTKGTKF